MKLCKDCKHFNMRTVSQCTHALNQQDDMVHGGTRYIWPFAQSVRNDKTMCGPDAEWFELRAEQVMA